MQLDPRLPRFLGSIKINKDSYPTQDPQVSSELRRIWAQHVQKLERAADTYRSQFEALPGVDVTISCQKISNNDIAEVIIDNSKAQPSDKNKLYFEKKIGHGRAPENFLGLAWDLVLSRLGLINDELSYPKQFIKRVLLETQKSYQPH